MKKVIAVILAVTLGLLLVPSAVTAASGIQIVGKSGDGAWTEDTWQVEMFPGESKATTLTLHNSSGSSLDVAVSVSPSSLDNGNLTFELDKSIFTMSGKSYVDVTLSVMASGSGTPGIYTVGLSIRSEVPPAPTGGGGGGVSMFRLYDLTIENVTENSADVLWRTSRSTTSELTYWSEFKAVVEDESYLWEHTVHLEELKDNTTYHFEITCRDKRGLEKGTTGEFTTLEKEVVPDEPEPAIPEPEEPVLPEPTEPEVVEPEEEPTLPEEEEPEVVEPEEEPYMPPEKPGTPWGLIGGVVGGLAASGGIGYWLWRRRKKEANDG